MANGLKAGGHNLLVWQLGLGRADRMLDATFLTITGTRSTGRNFWDFVSIAVLICHVDLNTSFSGKTLERNLRRSLAWKKSQRGVATLISGAYSTATIEKWNKMRDEFDLDNSKPNPYEEVDNRRSLSSNFLGLFLTSPIDVTMHQLKMELLKEEARELSQGGPLHQVSAGAFLRKAVEIEDRQ